MVESGVNAATEKYEGVIKAWQATPQRSPHRSAECSLASRCMTLTTEAMIAEIQEEKGHGGGTGGMGM